MADLPILSPLTAPEPTLAPHVATKNYVDTAGGDAAIRTVTAGTVLGLSDVALHVNSSAATTVTVPTHATAGIPVNARRWVRKMGTGNVSVVGASGVTINWVGGLFTITAQYADAELHKIAANTWVGFLR